MGGNLVGKLNEGKVCKEPNKSKIHAQEAEREVRGGGGSSAMASRRTERMDKGPWKVEGRKEQQPECRLLLLGGYCLQKYTFYK